MVQSTTARRLHGYTIVEVMVVLAVLAVLSVVAIPWFLKVSQRQALKSAAREIQITLTAARMAAVKRNAPVSVAFASLTPPMRMVVIEPQPPAPTPTIPAQQVILPQNAVRMKQTPETGNAGIMTFGGDGRVQTTAVPGNVLTPRVMIVEGPVNSSPRNEIRIETSARGSVKIVTPVDWQ